jgi:hypothetical protein
MTERPMDLTPKKPISKKTKEEQEKAHKYQRDKDREMVKGRFLFHEVPGGVLSFPFKKWKEDEVEVYHLTDGQIYTLPLAVAKHLNQNCAYPEYGYIQGEPGTVGGFSHVGHTMKVTKWIRRTSFQSLEFLDIPDLDSTGGKIVTVEYANGNTSAK